MFLYKPNKIQFKLMGNGWALFCKTALIHSQFLVDLPCDKNIQIYGNILMNFTHIMYDNKPLS